MDILAARVYLERSALEVAENALKSCCDSLGFLNRYDPGGGEHSRMGNAAADILLVHTAVKAYRRIKIIRKRACDTACNARPHLCTVFILSHFSTIAPARRKLPF